MIFKFSAKALTDMVSLPYLKFTFFNDDAFIVAIQINLKLDNSFSFSDSVDATLAHLELFCFLKPRYLLVSSGLLKLKRKAPQGHLSDLVEKSHVDMEWHRFFKLRWSYTDALRMSVRLQRHSYYSKTVIAF